jgi:hypothetical protein
MRIINMSRQTSSPSHNAAVLESGPANPVNPVTLTASPRGGADYDEVKRLAHEY